ncbi:MAG TPA: 3-dehydroquinate synthase [Eubacterium sp.]|nr:3-dehydroquinate synthase [Eubacterium sp.]
MLDIKELNTTGDELNVLTVNYEGKPCYDIVFSNSFDQLNRLLSKFLLREKKVCIITDDTIAPLYLDEVKKVFAEVAGFVTEYVINAGEEYKTLRTVEGIYKHLIETKFDRNDYVIALGGGVVGDMTGYVAATYLRGISFIQIPTTLLSQVDSSIGGKTGVDLDGYKNMIGAFYQPKLVYINVSTLKSLNRRIFLSGMGEIIKHGIIKDKDYLNWLRSNNEKIIDRDPEILIQMIKNSCYIKKCVVENDPKEKGERALLNFGHTIGHSVEKLYNFEKYHGECVAIGMVVAAYISKNKGFISESEAESIKRIVSIFELPNSITGLKADSIIEVSKNDKKMDSKKIKFIVIKDIGEAIIDSSITDDDMRNAILEATEFEPIFGAAD